MDHEFQRMLDQRCGRIAGIELQLRHGFLTGLHIYSGGKRRYRHRPLYEHEQHRDGSGDQRRTSVRCGANYLLLASVDHVRNTCRQSIRSRALRHQRNSVFRFGGDLHFDDASDLHFRSSLSLSVSRLRHFGSSMTFDGGSFAASILFNSRVARRSGERCRREYTWHRGA